MGDEVLSSFEAMEMEVVDKEKNMENFLPRTGLRVLLVEADDSTRQIIGALLRKCSYRVATASDGLKAWEMLKARPHNIDLILTDMELPSISGYALLSLIMEHDICKNIPVKMMSSCDSISMVYKCMMRGGADFLAKPIRINELRNLWQHVWRRQSQVSRGGHGPQDESVAEEKLEATAENNAITISDRSSGSKACVPRREGCVKKGSDAQSSCGKLDLETESSYTAEVEDYSQPKQGLSPVTELQVQERHNCGHSGQTLSTPESAAADTAAYSGNSALDRDEKLEQQRHAENVNLCTQASGNEYIITSSSREAIDFIGAFDNYCKHNSCSNDGVNRYDSSPHLDLSMTGCSPIVLENKISYEDQMLNHSNVSPFTRYVNKTVHASNSIATSDPTPTNNKVDSGDHLADKNAPDSNSSAKDSLLQYGQKAVSIPVNLTKEAEKEFINVSQIMFPIRLPVGDVCSTPAGYGSSVPPTVRTLSRSPSLSFANPQMNCYNQFNADVISTPKISSNQSICKQDQKTGSLDDQSASSSICNDTVGHLNSREGGNEQTHATHDLNRQRSLQKEASINKFLLKRKERCYDKKVRYESRKKLAEQRPRVKGQFVRQLPPAISPPKSDNSGCSSVAN